MKNFTKIFTLGIAAAAVIFLQAFDYTSDDSDKNPNIDGPPRWVLEMRAQNQYRMTDAVVITTPDGYDNYDMGVDFAENNVAQNPRNPLASFIPYNTNGTHYTTNGGLNWLVNNPVFGGSVAGDPVAVYDSLGNLYYDNMKNPITGTWIAKSTNNAVSWVFANVTANLGNDKNWIAADQTAGPFANFIYGSMTTTGGASFNRSTNGGTSFQNIGTLSPHVLPGTMPCVGPNGSISGGSVYVVTNSGAFNTPTYTFFRSTDGGATLPTLQSSQSGWVNTVGTIVGGRNSVNNMRTRPYPYIAADNSYGPFRGRLYCIYAANDPPGSGNKPDIWCRYSTDFGVTFSAPVRINDDASTTNHNQWHPAIWCDKETGRLYVNWMDTRNTPTSDSAEIYASYSSNGGVSWVTNQKISNAKMRIDCPTCGGGGTPRYQGDYNGIVSNSQGSLSGWGDFRNGNFGSYSAYFPDYAMRVLPSAYGMGNVNDSAFSFVSVPSVKLYTHSVKFTASITPAPGAGTVTLTFLNKANNNLLDSLTSYPDSLRIRIRATGGVTPGIYTVRVVGRGPNGTPVHERSISVNIGFVGLVNNNNEVPNKFFLYQNYPNPFNPATNIKFDVPKSGFVKLTVFDITGKAVQTLVNENLAPGSYSYDFDAAMLASGIYFYRIETPEFTGIRKMILVK